MAIPWNAAQRRKVSSALAKYPADSSKCAAAARQLLPVAKEVHPGAYGIQLLPAEPAPYLLTTGGHRKWYHHVLVEVIEHRVDALTGPSGDPARQYLALRFQYPDDIRELEVDVESIDPGIQSDD